MTAIVYRIIDGQRQYLRRQVGRLYLWHEDRAVAHEFDDEQARLLAAAIRQRSIGEKQHPPTMPAGIYATEAIE